MKFSDFVAIDAIRSHVDSSTKEGVIREMATALVEAGRIPASDLESIVKAILKREDLGTTGIGRGVAVPHTKHPSVDRLVGTVAVSQEGIDFDSLDGDPVHLFFLLVSPPDQPGQHLRALENISRQLRDDAFCRELKAAKAPADIQHLLEARKWQSRIELVSMSQRVDGKSILEVLTLAAEEGTRLVVEVTGPDATEALAAIVRLFDGNFHENDETAVNTAGRTTTP